MFLRTLIISLLLVSLKLTAQQGNQEVEFNLSLLQGDSKVSLGELFSADGKKYKLSTFKFFISDPHFFKNGKELHPNSNEVQLVDFSEEKSPSWVWNYPIDQEADSVSFNIGLSK
ncbi:MAG: MbnP family protein, partial [Flavobacteriales bacterium]